MTINIQQSVMSALRWVTISRIAAQLLTWANTFLVIRLLSPDEFGLAALAGIFVSFLTLINEFGFSVAIVQRQTRDPEILQHIFGALLAVGAVLTVGMALSAPAVAIAVKEPRVIPLVRLLSLQFIISSFAVIPQARLSIDMRFKELSVSTFASSLIGAVATLAFALGGAGAWSLIIGSVVVNLSRSLVLNLQSPWVLAPRLEIAKIRDFSRFSGLVLLERTLWFWYTQLDTFVVGRALGAAEVGIYSVAKQVTSIPLERAMGIINSIALPAFSTVKSDPDHVRRGYGKVLRLGAGYAFPVFWGLMAVSAPAVRLVLGEKWTPAVIVMQLLCLSMPLRMLNSFTSAAVTSIDRQMVNIKSLLLAIVIIPAFILIGCRWGLIGVAGAWVIGFPIVYLFNASLVRRALRMPWSDMIAAVWPACAAAAAMVVVLEVLGLVWLNAQSPIIQLGIAIPAGALTFGAALRMASRDSAHEIWAFARGLVSSGA